MIVIDTDLTYIGNRLGLSEAQLNAYGMKSVDEILKAEAANGNEAAIKLATEMFTNVDRLVELFKLADPNNKYAILREMTHDQLKDFLPLMEEKDLQQGLYFFTQDKLLEMLEKVPPEQLVKTVLEMFSEEEVIQLMPEEQLDKFLTSTDIDKNKMLEHLKSIPPEYLAQMLESVSGKPVEDMDIIDMVKQVGQLNPLQYRDALTSMQPVQKQQLVLGLAKQEEKLFQLFDPHAYTNMINQQKQKPDLVKAMGVLEPEEVIKMLEELPNDLLSIVITQIDAKDFADQLINRFPEVLASIIAR